MRLNFSIRSFLVLLAVCFTVPAVLLFGFFEARSGMRQARDDAREMNGQAALLIDHDIAATLEQFKALTEGLAVDVNLDKLRFENVDRVKQVLDLYSGISFLILDQKAVSVQAYSVTFKVPLGIDYSGRGYVREAMATRKTVISDGLTRDGVNPVVAFCVPLMDSNGIERGMLAGVVPTRLFSTHYPLAPEQFATGAGHFRRYGVEQHQSFRPATWRRAERTACQAGRLASGCRFATKLRDGRRQTCCL